MTPIDSNLKEKIIDYVAKTVWKTSAEFACLWIESILPSANIKDAKDIYFDIRKLAHSVQFYETMRDECHCSEDYKKYEEHFFKATNELLDYIKDILSKTSTKGAITLKGIQYAVNFEIRNITIPDLQILHDVDLSKYKIANKRQILRNCVHYSLGKHVLDCLHN